VGRIVVPLETIDVSAWVAKQTGKHVCACGCGKAIRIDNMSLSIRRIVP
jgi:hypothetical protein